VAITRKSVTAGTNNGSTATVSVTTAETSATAVGDVVVIIYGNNYYALSNMGTPSATGTPTMNAITAATADGGSNFAHIKAWWYVANTSGAQTITATETGSHDEEKYLLAYVFSGADTTAPIDAAAGGSGGATTPNPAPSVSPTTSDAYLIAATSSGGGNWTAGYTTPAPLTENGELSVGGLAGVYATVQLSASGATGAYNFVPDGSVPYASVTIAVKVATATAAATPAPNVINRAANVRASTW
jgi:hypothetical protein